MAETCVVSQLSLRNVGGSALGNDQEVDPGESPGSLSHVAVGNQRFGLGFWRTAMPQTCSGSCTPTLPRTQADLAEPPYSVDVDAMNRELVGLVNMAQGGAFLALGSAAGDHGRPCAALVVGGNPDHPTPSHRHHILLPHARTCPHHPTNVMSPSDKRHLRHTGETSTDTADPLATSSLCPGLCVKQTIVIAARCRRCRRCLWLCG